MLLFCLFSDTLFFSSSSCLAYYIHTYIIFRAHCIGQSFILLSSFIFGTGMELSFHTSKFHSPSLPWWLILIHIYILFDYYYYFFF